MTYVHTCIYITSTLLFFSLLYTSSILLGRLADPYPSHRTQLWYKFTWYLGIFIHCTVQKHKLYIVQLGSHCVLMDFGLENVEIKHNNEYLHIYTDLIVFFKSQQG
jgi:hypothetical protein